ncbi:MAG: signal peptidase I [Ruminococcus sp.]|nr:signal peptidase I [Ruminococcus sp.]
MQQSGREQVNNFEVELPSTAALENELSRIRYNKNFVRIFKSTVYTLITVSAVAILVAVLLLPVLRIYGSSMTPTLAEDNIVVSVKTNDLKTGDVIAFYYNNKILVKRVIAQANDWIFIDEYGTIYINDKPIEEDYVTEKSFGECDIELPYQVPESKVFVMGDHRSVSIDSRSTTIGCVSDEQIVGKIIFRIWPIKEIGAIK